MILISKIVPDKFSAPLRVLIPLYTTYLLFVLSVAFVFLPMLRNHMMDQKKAMIHELTESTLSLLSEYQQRVERGELSPEEARKRAVSRIRNLRYGPQAKDYFWILDMGHQVIMHPYVTALEGKDQAGFVDSKGKHVFAEFVRTVQQKGEGYVEYMWQWKDDPVRDAPKISYVKGFAPWGWILGTGLYVDDVHREISVIAGGFARIFLGVLGIVVLLSVYITRQTLRIEVGRKHAEAAKELEELRLKKLLELSRMTNASVRELTAFALEEAIHLTRSRLGYLAFLNEEETHLTMHTWSRHVMAECEVREKTLVYPIHETGLWAESARTRDTVMINDYENLTALGKKGCPPGHVKVSRFLSVPIFDNGRIAALAGVGNKPSDYDESDIRQLRLMMDGMWNIIQKKQAEDTLRESEERYRMLAENATDTIWIVQLPDLTFSFVSPAVTHFLGYRPDEIVGRPIQAFLTDSALNDFMAAISEEAAFHAENPNATRRYRTLEAELIRKDKTPIFAETTACFLMNQQGQPDRILGIARDVTQRLKLEKNLRQAQKMEALGTLAGGIAHDFNNILSSVLGFAELAKMSSQDNEETLKNLDQILSAGLRARDLVRHILTFSRRADTEKQVIDIAPLVKECLKFLKASVPPDIGIQFRLDRETGLILADPTQIHQVIMNLLTNAAHAMKERGGTLDVGIASVEIQSGEKIQAGDLKPGRYLQLTVSDTGCGIPKDVIGRIFEPFFTTKGPGEGTGMGLSTVYGIVKDMGGAVSVYSEPGMGTAFQVLLPEHHGKTIIERKVSDNLPLIGRGRILLVDDEPSIVDWSRQVLLKFGYEVVAFTDSRQALEHFAETPDAFDLVLTDMAMPGLNGLDLSVRLIGIRPDIAIVLCTGFSEGLTEGKMKDAGIRDMIMKPMIAGELARAVQKAMKGPSGIEPHKGRSRG